MKPKFLFLFLVCALAICGLAYSASTPAPAAKPAAGPPGPAAGTAKTYQVTGPIVALTDTMITVMKGKDKWEIARDPSTKGPADLKVGNDVTIQYRMTATTVEIKEAKAAKAA